MANSETRSQIPLVSNTLKHYAKGSIKRWKFNIKILTLYHQHWELNENLILRKLHGEFHHNPVKGNQMDDNAAAAAAATGDCVIILKWIL